MFDKIKSRKAPISLSSVSNAIKTSGTSDLSPREFSPKQIDAFTEFQLGIPKNSIVAVAHDPVQSLLAISTSKNEIRIYGQNHVEVVFEFKSTTPMTKLMFVRGIYLVAVSSIGGEITVISLHQKKILGTFSPPGAISTVVADPSLDWLIIGLSNGSIVVYDIDRLNLTPFRIDNLQKRVLPKQKLSPVLAIEWHPRDIGTVLISYSHSAILYSMVTGEIVSVFVYELQKGLKGYEYSQSVANGGKKKLFGSSSAPVISEVVEAHFHPNGLHVVTIHVDNSIVFWDAQDGKLLQARTIEELNLHKQGPPMPPPQEPLYEDRRIQAAKWVCAADSETTQLVLVIGNLVHILDFGYTLKYSLTSHEKQGEFYAKPAGGQRVLPVTFNSGSKVSSNSKDPQEPEYLENIIPLTLDCMPYFSGGFNPSYLVLLSNKGSIYIVKYNQQTSVAGASAPAPRPTKPAFDPYSMPSGSSYSDYADFNSSDSSNSQKSLASSNLILPPSIALVLPPVVYSQVVSIRKVDWFGICSSRSNNTSAALDNPVLLKGGAPADNKKIPRSIGYDDTARNILVTGHERGIVRLLDVSRGEHQDIQDILQVSLQGIVYAPSQSAIKVVNVSCAFESKELLIGLNDGSVIICKYGRSKNNSAGDNSKKDYSECQLLHQNGDSSILSLTHRVPRATSNASSFLPFAVLKTTEGNVSDKISCMKMSDVGFAAIAFKSGKLIVCDISRGPAIIFNVESILKFLPSIQGVCYATSMEFSIAEYGQDGYSSILLTLATCAGGNLVMFKIIPQSNGAFECVFVDKTLGLNYKTLGGASANPEDAKINQLIPISVKNGDSTVAELGMFQKLSQGVVIPSYLITASPRDIRVLRLPKQKLSHKVIEDTCLRTGIIRLRGKGVILAVLVKAGFIRFLSLPALNELTDFKLPKDTYLQVRSALESGIASDSDILPTGEVFLRTGLSECTILSVFLQDGRLGKKSVDTSTDLLFNENAIIPPRPSAGSLQWVKGQTKYVSLDDLSQLIAGPNRKPSKNEETRLAYNISPEAHPNQAFSYGAPGGNPAADTSASGSAAGGRAYKEPVRGGNKAGGYNFGTNGFMRSIQTGIESLEESVNGYASNISESMNESVEGTKSTMYSSALKNKLGF